MTREDAAYWADLAKDLEDPEFRRVFEEELDRITAVDRANGEGQ